MQFNPLSHRLSEIPKGDLFGPDTVTILSSITNELDIQADAMRAVGAASHREIAVLSNNVVSVSNAIEDGDATLAMMRDLRERLSTYDKSLSTYDHEYTTAKVGAKTDRYNETVASFSKALAGYTVEAANEALHPTDTVEDEETAATTPPKTALAADLEEVLKNLAQRNRAIQRRLPRNNVDKYAVVKLPVLVLVQNKLDPKKLDKLGFEVNDFEGYPIIEDQMLLAVKTSYAKAWDMLTGDMAEEILPQLSQVAGDEMVFVHDDGRNAKGSSGFMYYWIMPKRFFNKLAPVMGEFNDWSIAL